MGYLIKETHWTYKEIQESPAGFIDDLLLYFNAYSEEEERRMKVASSGNSVDREDKPGFVSTSGLDPKTSYEGFTKTDRPRMTPPPPHLLAKE